MTPRRSSLSTCGLWMASHEPTNLDYLTWIAEPRPNPKDVIVDILTPQVHSPNWSRHGAVDLIMGRG